MLLRPPEALFVPAHVIPLVHPRTVVTVHDLGYLYFPEAHPTPARMYLDLSTRWNARVATHVIADSQATKDDLERYYAVPPGKITVAYPGRDESLGRVDDPLSLEAAKQRYGITGEYLLYIVDNYEIDGLTIDFSRCRNYFKPGEEKPEYMTSFLKELRAGLDRIGMARKKRLVLNAEYAAWLQEALALLEPRSPGRPAKPEPPIEPSEVQSLRERVRELEARAAAVEVQAELARTLPHVLHRPQPGKKTKSSVRRRPVRLPPQSRKAQPCR